jgi:hypothetical protein
MLLLFVGMLGSPLNSTRPEEQNANRLSSRQFQILIPPFAWK